MNEKIPKLYETEETPTEKKMIYRKYELASRGFYWLIAELDPERNLAFGYANLADDQMAEWGYIDVRELLENGAELNRSWEPCTYREARQKIADEMIKDWNDGMARFKRRYFGRAKQPKLDDHK